MITPLVLAMPGAPSAVPEFRGTSVLPEMYTPSGQPVFPLGQSSDNVAPNTEMEQDLNEPRGGTEHGNVLLRLNSLSIRRRLRSRRHEIRLDARTLGGRRSKRRSLLEPKRTIYVEPLGAHKLRPMKMALRHIGKNAGPFRRRVAVWLKPNGTDRLFVRHIRAGLPDFQACAALPLHAWRKHSGTRC